MKLKTLEPVVLNILEHNKIAREDDFILYGAVLKRFGIDLKISIAEFLATAKNNNMPTFESVSRCRRHITELRQDLKANTVKRQEQEEIYKAYNISGLLGGATKKLPKKEK